MAVALLDARPTLTTGTTRPFRPRKGFLRRLLQRVEQARMRQARIEVERYRALFARHAAEPAPFERD